TAGPDGGVNVSRIRRAGSARCCPAICSGVVSPTGVHVLVAIIIKKPDPDNHHSPGPDGGVTVSHIGRVGGAGCCPTVCGGIVSPAVGGYAALSLHDALPIFTAGPDGGVNVSRIGHAGSARCCPAITSWVVSPTCVQIIRRRI